MLIVKGYDGTVAGAKLVNRAILVVSRPIIHVELYDTDTELSHSSEFGIGPRTKKINYSHPERWPEEYQVPIPYVDIGKVLDRIEKWTTLQKLGLSEYDLRGAIGCFWSGQENPWNPFCSEFIFDVLHSELDLSHVLNHKMHPMRLIELLKGVTE